MIKTSFNTDNLQIVSQDTVSYKKFFDFKSGQYFYASNNTDEVFWDRPAGIRCKLEEDDRLRINYVQPEQVLERVQECQETQVTVSKLLNDRIEDVKRKASDEIFKKHQHYEKLWAVSLEHASEGGCGELVMSWEGLETVHDWVYAFESETKIKMKSIRLIGHGMSVLPVMLCNRMYNLEHLSLMNNDLVAIPEEISNLSRLVELNLSRNKLKSLPDSIGHMNQLTSFEIYDNNLESLPTTIAALSNITRFNVENNCLKSLPDGICFMKCVELNIGHNKLASLPRLLYLMENLVKLIANSNNISYINDDLCKCKKLAHLHLSANKLHTIPDSLSKCEPLKSLWLESNFICRLPLSFHTMSRLVDLRLDNNPNMNYPTFDIISQGTDQVLKWCKDEYFSDRIGRARRIVHSFLDVLSQVEEFGIYSKSEFEPNTMLRTNTDSGQVFSIDEDLKTLSIRDKMLSLVNQPRHATNQSVNVAGSASETDDDNKRPEEMDKWFAIADLDVVWSSWLPKLQDEWNTREPTNQDVHIRNFSTSRREVSWALKTYYDSYGSIVKIGTGWFKECACKDSNGTTRICAPPRKPYMCSRQAILVKCKPVLAHHRKQREWIKYRRQQLEYSLEGAERASRSYLKSEDGDRFIKVAARRRAEKLYGIRLDSMKNDKREGKFRQGSEARKAALLATKKLLDGRRQERRDELLKCQDKIERQLMQLKGWKKELKQGQLDQVNDALQRLEADPQIKKLEEELEAIELQSKPEDENIDIDNLDADDFQKRLHKKRVRVTLFRRLAVMVNHAIENADESMKRAVGSRQHDYGELLHELEQEVRVMFVDASKNAAKRKVTHELDCLERVRASFSSLCVKQVYEAWRDYVKSKQDRMVQDMITDYTNKKASFVRSLGSVAIAQIQVALWDEFVDEYSDKPYWIHKKTGECTWVKPEPAQYLPSNFRLTDTPTRLPDEIQQIVDYDEDHASVSVDEVESIDSLEISTMNSSMSSHDDSIESIVTIDDGLAVDNVVNELISCAAKLSNGPSTLLLKDDNDDGLDKPAHMAEIVRLEGRKLAKYVLSKTEETATMDELREWLNGNLIKHQRVSFARTRARRRKLLQKIKKEKLEGIVEADESEEEEEEVQDDEEKDRQNEFSKEASRVADAALEKALAKSMRSKQTSNMNMDQRSALANEALMEIKKRRKDSKEVIGSLKQYGASEDFDFSLPKLLRSVKSVSDSMSNRISDWLEVDDVYESKSQFARRNY